MIRPLHPDEEPQVRALARRCAPRTPDNPPGWFTAYPTLVDEQDERLVGYTSFGTGPAPDGKCEAVYGKGLGVLPLYRKTGLGTALHAARCALGWNVGARVFIGLTSPDNHAMIAIFTRQGLQSYPHPGTDTVVWVGAITGSA